MGLRSVRRGGRRLMLILSFDWLDADDGVWMGERRALHGMSVAHRVISGGFH
jgi:hypothetical protein